MLPERPTDIPWQLLDRYIVGDVSPAEMVEVRAWVAADPGTRESFLNALRQDRVVAGVASPVWDSRTAWQRIAPDLGRSSGLPVTHRRPGAMPRPTRWRWATVGASLVVALGLVLAAELIPAGHRPWLPGREYVTVAGQRLSVTLMDGTQVTLAPESRLRLPRDYGHGTREARLEGEAYFAVVHDAAHPFAVKTAYALTRDVGTRFVVQAYGGDSGERVAVVEGAVVVQRGDGGRVGDPPLRGGDVADITADGIAVMRHVDISDLTVWMQGGLVFDEKPLKDVVREIGRTFGVQITIADSALAGRRVTATFSNQPLSVVLDEVTRVVGARYEQSGKGVVIRAGIIGTRDQANGPRTPLTTARAEEQRAHE